MLDGGPVLFRCTTCGAQRITLEIGYGKEGKGPGPSRPTLPPCDPTRAKDDGARSQNGLERSLWKVIED